ncbi:MAG: DoxX family protein [Rubrobacteraceae bacterium]
MVNVKTRLHQFETRVMQWLVRRSIMLLRVSLGAVFIGFGLLKFFPGLSPAAGLATQTTSVLTLGLIPAGVSIFLIAALECTIGLGLITGKFLRLTLLLLGFQMLGAMSPLLLFPGELFAGPLHAPTLEAQYVIKDVVLIGAGLVIGATLHGGRIVTERVRRAENYKSYVPRRHPENPQAREKLRSR